MGGETAVKIINAVNEPVTKLIETVSKAIGKVYEPHYTKKKADAEAYRIEKISDAIRNNCDLPIKYNAQDQTTMIDTSSIEELAKRTGERLAYQEMKKQQNIESVVSKTAVLLENETDVSSEKVDDDWMIRFINSIEDISDEEMQSLWAKILAGEIKQPKTCSLRTLEVVRNLSADDVDLFKKISCVVLDNTVIGDTDFLDAHSISYSDILKLDDCRLINSNDSILNINIENNKILFNNAKYGVIAELIDIKKKGNIRIKVHVLTEPAKNLIKYIKYNDNSNLTEIGKFIKNSNTDTNIKISVHQIIEDDGKEISFEKENLI